MTKSKKPKRKPKDLAQVIREATTRALKAMEDASARPMHTYEAGEINGWKADALASYVWPKVLRSVATWSRNRKRK